MKRPIAAALAALTLLVGCGRGSSSSAEQIAIRWRWAYEQGDAATEWDLEAAEFQPGHGDRATGIAFLKSLYKPVTPDHQVVTIKATSTVKDTGDPKNTFVFVYLDAKPRDYPAHHEVVTLRKVGGAWRVARWQP